MEDVDGAQGDAVTETQDAGRELGSQCSVGERRHQDSLVACKAGGGNRGLCTST